MHNFTKIIMTEGKNYNFTKTWGIDGITQHYHKGKTGSTLFM
jgi:hypothetical protein